MTVYAVSDRETIASVSTAVGFTSSKLVASLIYARIQAIDGDVRITEDGTTPTSSKGFKLVQNSTVEVWGTTAMSDFLCIDDGGSAKLEVIYYKR